MYLFDNQSETNTKINTKLDYLVHQSKLNNLILFDVHKAISSFSEHIPVSDEDIILGSWSENQINDAISRYIAIRKDRKPNYLEIKILNYFLLSRDCFFQDILFLLLNDKKVTFCFSETEKYEMLCIESEDDSNRILEPKDCIELPLENEICFYKDYAASHCRYPEIENPFTLEPQSENAFKNMKKYRLNNNYWIYHGNVVAKIKMFVKCCENTSNIIYTEADETNSTNQR